MNEETAAAPLERLAETVAVGPPPSEAMAAAGRHRLLDRRGAWTAGVSAAAALIVAGITVFPSLGTSDEDAASAPTSHPCNWTRGRIELGARGSFATYANVTTDRACIGPSPPPWESVDVVAAATLVRLVDAALNHFDDTDRVIGSFVRVAPAR